MKRLVKFPSYMLFVIALGMVLTFLSGELSSQQSAAVRIDGDDIGGVVTSDKGPEAGVWVIAETSELPTKLANGCHRRSGTLRDSRSATRQLQRLGARLWADRFSKSSQHTRKNS